MTLPMAMTLRITIPWRACQVPLVAIPPLIECQWKSGLIVSWPGKITAIPIIILACLITTLRGPSLEPHVTILSPMLLSNREVSSRLRLSRQRRQSRELLGSRTDSGPWSRCSRYCSVLSVMYDFNKWVIHVVRTRMTRLMSMTCQWWHTEYTINLLISAKR